MGIKIYIINDKKDLFMNSLYRKAEEDLNKKLSFARLISKEYDERFSAKEAK